MDRRIAAGSRAQFVRQPLQGMELRRVLQRERMRADRCDRPLTVVRLPAGGSPDESARLEGVLRNRLRATDEFGRLDDGRHVLILPDTAAKNAEVLLDDLARLYGGGLDRQDMEVFQHPATGRRDPMDPPAEDDRKNAVSAERVPPLHRAAGRTGPLAPWFAQRLPWWKRTLDVAVALAGLLLLWPLMLAAAVLIKLTSPGPVLFSQLREGRAGAVFRLYKFRTMRVGADAEKHALRARSEQDGPAFKMRNDPRVTRVGRWLRATCIDELPQLWNVLKGEMSLVGPRPLPCDESRACQSWQRRRLDVTPGLTCLWQVQSGSRVSFVQWMRLDLRYANSYCLLGDLRLLLHTALAIARRRTSG